MVVTQYIQVDFVGAFVVTQQGGLYPRGSSMAIDRV